VRCWRSAGARRLPDRTGRCSRGRR
jgi:hypothetical protein